MNAKPAHAMNVNLARVEHWNGFVIKGIITGGDGKGIFVQKPDHEPVFCDFQNVRAIYLNQAA